MAILKNIAQEQVLLLAQQVEAEAGQIVSKTLAQNDAVSITLFAFSKGEEISTIRLRRRRNGARARGPRPLYHRRQRAFLLRGREHRHARRKPHAVYAAEDFKMLLTVVFPQN